MPGEPAALDPTAIVPAPGQEPFTPAPLIHDILRTGYCTPGSIFLVEGIDIVPVSRTGRWQTVRLLLGDGELCVQALLAGAMQRFVETGDVYVGCYVRLESFQLQWYKVTDDQDGDARERDTLCVLLDDLVTIGWNDSYRNLWRAQHEEAVEELVAEDDLDLEEMDREYSTADADKAQLAAPGPVLETNKPREQPEEQKELGEPGEPDAAVEDPFEEFEALNFPAKKTQPASKANSSSAKTSSSSSARRVEQPIALPRDWHDRSTPLKLTTLYSIPYLPYRQNWSVNVLAIIVSLSPVEPSPLPPYKQRKARIADPSTAKQVHLSIFLDPDEFTPAVGSAVLLVGVKNHPFDGGSLKKYVSDAPYGQWWFEEPWEMGWCDVDGIKRWWTEMQSSAAA